jgi:hypothetical protein
VQARGAEAGRAEARGAKAGRAEAGRAEAGRAEARRAQAEPAADAPWRQAATSATRAGAGRTRARGTATPGRVHGGFRSGTVRPESAVDGLTVADGLAVVRPAGTEPDRSGATLPRMPFVLLVLALLGGGLVCLLVINTTLGASSFRITQLQRTNSSLMQQQRTLQGEIAGEKTPAQIARLAQQLGMRSEANTSILDVGKHRTYQLSGSAGATNTTSAGLGQ